MEPHTCETNQPANYSFPNTTGGSRATANLLSRFNRAEQHNLASNLPSDMYESQQPQSVPVADPSPMPSPLEDAVCTIGQNITGARDTDLTPTTLLRTTTRRTLCAQFEQMSVVMTAPNQLEDACAVSASPLQGGTSIIEKLNQALKTENLEPEFDSPELLPWGQSNGWKRPVIKEGLHQTASQDAQSTAEVATVPTDASHMPANTTKEEPHIVSMTKGVAVARAPVASKATGVSKVPAATKPTALTKPPVSGKLAVAARALAAKAAPSARPASAKPSVLTKPAASARPIAAAKTRVPATEPQSPGSKLSRPAPASSAVVKKALSAAASVPVPIRKTGTVLPKPAGQSAITKNLPAAIKRLPTVPVPSSKPPAPSNAGRLTGPTGMKDAAKPPLSKPKFAFGSSSHSIASLTKKVQPWVPQKDSQQHQKPVTKAIQIGPQRELKATIRPAPLKAVKQPVFKPVGLDQKLQQQPSKKLLAGKDFPAQATSRTAHPSTAVEGSVVAPKNVAPAAATTSLAVGSTTLPPTMASASLPDMQAGLVAEAQPKLAAEVGPELTVDQAAQLAVESASPLSMAVEPVDQLAQMAVDSASPLSMEVGHAEHPVASVQECEAVSADPDSPMEMELGSPVPSKYNAVQFAHAACTSAGGPFAHAISAASELRTEELTVEVGSPAADEDTAMSPARDCLMADSGQATIEVGNFLASHGIAVSSDLFAPASSSQEHADSDCSYGTVSHLKEKIDEVASIEHGAETVAVIKAAADVQDGDGNKDDLVAGTGDVIKEEGAVVEAEAAGVEEAEAPLRHEAGDIAVQEVDTGEEVVDEEDDEADEEVEVDESEFLHENEHVHLTMDALEHDKDALRHVGESVKYRERYTEPEPIMLVPDEPGLHPSADNFADGGHVTSDDAEMDTAADTSACGVQWQRTAVLVPHDSGKLTSADSAEANADQDSKWHMHSQGLEIGMPSPSAGVFTEPSSTAPTSAVSRVQSPAGRTLGASTPAHNFTFDGDAPTPDASVSCGTAPSFAFDHPAPTPDTGATHATVQSFAFGNTAPIQPSSATCVAATSFAFDAFPAISSQSFDGFARVTAGFHTTADKADVPDQPGRVWKHAVSEVQSGVSEQVDSQGQLDQRFGLLELEASSAGKNEAAVSSDAVERRTSFCFPTVPALALPRASISGVFGFNKGNMIGEATPTMARSLEQNEQADWPSAGGDLQPMDSSPTLACFSNNLAASSCTFVDSPGAEEVSTLQTPRHMTSPMSVDGTPTTTPRWRAQRVPVATPPGSTAKKWTAQRVPKTAERPSARRVPVPSPGSKYKGKREVKMAELDENTAQAGTVQVFALTRSKKHQEQQGAGDLVMTPVRRSTRKIPVPKEGLHELTNQIS